MGVCFGVFWLGFEFDFLVFDYLLLSLLDCLWIYCFLVLLNCFYCGLTIALLLCIKCIGLCITGIYCGLRLSCGLL